MAQGYARKQLQQNPKNPLIVKIEGISNYNIKTEKDVIDRIISKKIPNFKHTKIILSTNQK